MTCYMKMWVSGMITTTQGINTIYINFADVNFRYSNPSSEFNIAIKTTNIRKFLKHCNRLKKEYIC
jgi:hypothetical protein